MAKVPLHIYSIAALLLITGCAKQIGPSHQELKEKLSEEVRTNVGDFEIEDTENLGTQTEPKIQSRYRAILKYKEEEDFIFPEVKEIIRKNNRFGKEYAEIYGLSTSTRQGSQWETKFTIEEHKNILKE